MNPPAFQFYADDFLGGTITMSHEERGFYILLLCLQWTQGGIDPDDFSRLGKAIAVPSLTHVKRKFKLEADGKLRNERLEAERRKQSDFRENRSKSGTIGANKRWHSHSTAITQPMANGMANDSSPSPSPISNKETEQPPLLDEPEIPDRMNTPAFNFAWMEWKQHRKEKKIKLTPLAIKKQMQFLEEIGPGRAVVAINHSIKSGYTGIFEPKAEKLKNDKPW